VHVRIRGFGDGCFSAVQGSHLCPVASSIFVAANTSRARSFYSTWQKAFSTRKRTALRSPFLEVGIPNGIYENQIFKSSAVV